MNQSNPIAYCGTSGKEPALELIKSLLLRKGDVQGIGLMKYRAVAREVFMDLNLDVLRFTERRWLPVDKKTLTVILPDNLLKLARVEVNGIDGRRHKVMFTDEHLYDVPVIQAPAGCGCGCGCTGKLCASIESYSKEEEDVIEDMPDETTKTFKKTTIRRVNADGSISIERTFPIRIYEDDEWIDTVLTTETENVCKVEVKEECGCIKQTAANAVIIENHCAGFIETDSCDRCVEPVPGYGINEIGDRLVMPPGFIYDKVLVVYYADGKLNDMLIPKYARKAFIYGLEDAVAIFDRDENQYRIEKFKDIYDKEKERVWGLHTRWTVNGIYSALTPERKML